jgi:hypothetical protein
LSRDSSADQFAEHSQISLVHIYLCFPHAQGKVPGILLFTLPHVGQMQFSARLITNISLLYLHKYSHVAHNPNVYASVSYSLRVSRVSKFNFLLQNQNNGLAVFSDETINITTEFIRLKVFVETQ